MVSEFLKRDDGTLVKVAEISAIANAVDETRDAVEHLEAKLTTLQEDDSPEEKE